MIESSLCVVFFSEAGLLGFHRVCAVKKLFKLFALSFSSV